MLRRVCPELLGGRRRQVTRLRNNNWPSSLVIRLDYFRTSRVSVAKKQPPKPPVPELRSTLSTYLEYAKVIANHDQYRRTRSFVEDFGNNEGPILQEKLLELARDTNNWINLFWLNDMYLNNRMPLPIFSNPGYIFPEQHFADTDDMIRYISHFVSGVYSYKERLDRRELPTDRSTGKNGGEPLCMEQYWRLFTSYRIPSDPIDLLDTNTNRNLRGNEHIVVFRNKMAFLVHTVVDGNRLNHLEIKHQLTQLLNMADEAERSETIIPVGLITAVDRDNVQLATQLLSNDSINRESLEAIQSSSFIICIDKSIPPPDDPTNAEAQLARRATYTLHGGGMAYNTANRWFNKTMQFTFTENGVCGLNYEHSVAEAIVVINLVEETLTYVKGKMQEKSIGSPRLKLQPRRLTWRVPAQVQEIIALAEEDTTKLIEDLDFRVLDYRGFGKEFLKSKRLSPDAVIQLTLQLTYYRLYHKLVSTYESATVRRFREGRVDNIRAATPEALNWVATMENEEANEEQKMRTFQEAINKQTDVMQRNVNGRGIDNHLVALHELSKTNLPNRPNIFSDVTFTELFRFPLSTSQVPTRLADTFMCYGPVVEDGYGCGYNPKANEILFIISSLKSCPTTNSMKFRNMLEKTLDDMKDMLQYFLTGKA